MEEVLQKRKAGRPKKAALDTSLVEGLEELAHGKVKLKSFGVADLMRAKFTGYELDGLWAKSIGPFMEEGATVLIYGKRKGGKTNHISALAKYLTQFVKVGSGVVYYNTYEQGKSLTLQNTVARIGFGEVAGKITWGDRESFAMLVQRLNGRNPPPFVFIDSIDTMRLTYRQWRFLKESFPRTCFFMISYCEGKHPALKWVKVHMAHEVDAICYVEDFVAYWESRFEGGEPYVIWREGAIRRGKLKREEVVPEDVPVSAILEEEEM